GRLTRRRRGAGPQPGGGRERRGHAGHAGPDAGRHHLRAGRGGVVVAGSGTAALREREDIILRVENLVVTFRLGRHERVQAVSDVSFDVARGGTLGLGGGGGCGSLPGAGRRPPRRSCTPPAPRRDG